MKTRVYNTAPPTAVDALRVWTKGRSPHHPDPSFAGEGNDSKGDKDCWEIRRCNEQEQEPTTYAVGLKPARSRIHSPPRSRYEVNATLERLQRSQSVIGSVISMDTWLTPLVQAQRYVCTDPWELLFTSIRRLEQRPQCSAVPEHLLGGSWVAPWWFHRVVP